MPFNREFSRRSEFLAEMTTEPLEYLWSADKRPKTIFRFSHHDTNSILFAILILFLLLRAWDVLPEATPLLDDNY